MKHEEALAALNLQVALLAGKSQGELVKLIDTPIHAEHESQSGIRYQVEIGAVWDNKPGNVLRLLFSVDDGGIRAYFPLTKSGFVHPDSCFDGEVE